MDLKNTHGDVIISANVDTIKALLLLALAGGKDLRGVNLSRAYLSEADLHGVNLSRAYLSEADLRGANLSRAYLSEADLREANLSEADLRGVNLSGANLREANLSRAYLSEADLRGANLSRAYLSEADLRRANLSCAYLSGADLRGANLRGAKNIQNIAQAQTVIAPEGNLVGWKKCTSGVIVKLLVPQRARRSNATGRKCRAEYVKVLQVFGASEGVSTYNPDVVYRKGETVKSHHWDEDRFVECGGGVHFFLTRLEAENY